MQTLLPLIFIAVLMALFIMGQARIARDLLIVFILLYGGLWLWLSCGAAV